MSSGFFPLGSKIVSRNNFTIAADWGALSKCLVAISLSSVSRRAESFSPEIPDSPGIVGITFGGAAVPGFRPLPGLLTLRAARGALHGPLGPLLRGIFRVGPGLVPLFQSHVVVGDFNSDRGVIEPGVVLLFQEKCSSACLPIIEVTCCVATPKKADIASWARKQ